MSQGTLGDLRVARAEFGKELTHVPRVVDWAQAGGALMDLGIYCVQFISMVFGGQKPEKISAVGRRHETGTVCAGLCADDKSDPPSLGALSWGEVSSPLRIKLDSCRNFLLKSKRIRVERVGRLCPGVCCVILAKGLNISESSLLVKCQ